jgi:hypothetical protein
MANLEHRLGAVADHITCWVNLRTVFIDVLNKISLRSADFRWRVDLRQ